MAQRVRADSVNWRQGLSVPQVEAINKDVDENVEKAAKLRHDGCTGKIVLITYHTVSSQSRFFCLCHSWSSVVNIKSIPVLL